MMLRYLVSLLFLLSKVTSYKDISPYTLLRNPSAASSSQINFAVENDYDDTGPGAKKPEYAYHTYKTLDEALIAYLDDPDTKLPEQERAKAVQKLIENSHIFGKPQYPLYYRKPTGFNNISPKRPFPYKLVPYNYPTNKVYFSNNANNFIKDRIVQKEPYKLEKFQTIRVNPLRLGHYTRDSELKSGFDQFEYFPKQAFSPYSTGDATAETRNAGVVHGYYTYLNKDGKHHTVHYSAKDAKN